MLPEPDRAKYGSGSAGTPAPPTNSSQTGRCLPARPGEARPRQWRWSARLGPTTDTRDLAGRLNAAGLTTGHGKPFDVAAVQWIRHAYKIPAPNPYDPGELSVAQAAGQLGCSTGVIYYWLKTGQLTARRGAGNRLCIPWTSQIEAGCG